MGYSISTYLVAILGFSTLAAAIKVTVEPIYVNNVEKAIIFDVNVKSSDLVCNVTADSDNYKVVWRRNQTDVTEIATFKERVFFPNEDTLKGGTMRIMRPTEDEVGNYTCVVISDGKEVANAEVQTFSNLKIKLSTSINVVESEKLRIHCFVIGKPIEQIWWIVVNDTEITETTGRYQLLKEEERDIENAILVIEDVQMFDRGEYKCVASGRLGTVEALTTVRVKDKYAALWPFLGICAEVFVLCAIILIYEKKRNKAELEESDTDQSPDQKNTPDHGKDSNLRHRQ